MSFLRALLALALLSTLTGCGFVHFGRLPEAASTDTALNTAYSNLSTEHKILKQELVLTRKEGEALRAALENRTDRTDPSPDLVARLNETTRELAALRASYAKLSETKSAAAPSAAPDAATAARARDLEEKLAVSLRNYTQLQEENARLRTEVDRTRAENTTLTAQVRTVTAQNAQAQEALAQLNTALLAQKEARARAEQQAAATAAQLTAVMARSNTAPATLAEARDTSARPTTAIAVPGGTGATAELRTTPARVSSTAEQAAAPATASDEPVRIHVVQATDTLEKIAQKYYGDPARWRTIYFANNAQLSGGRPLKPGMQLEVPKD
jgi:chromosome segregation ATPase